MREHRPRTAGAAEERISNLKKIYAEFETESHSMYTFCEAKHCFRRRILHRRHENRSLCSEAKLDRFSCLRCGACALVRLGL